MGISRVIASASAIALVLGTASAVLAATTEQVQWSPPASLNAGSNDPASVISTDGQRTTTIWALGSGELQASTSTGGEAVWQTPVPLGAIGDWPRLAGSSDAMKLTAVWKSRSTPSLVRSATSSDGGATWAPSVPVSASGDTPSNPQVVSSADGSRLGRVLVVHLQLHAHATRRRHNLLHAEGIGQH